MEFVDWEKGLGAQGPQAQRDQKPKHGQALELNCTNYEQGRINQWAWEVPQVQQDVVIKFLSPNIESGHFPDDFYKAWQENQDQEVYKSKSNRTGYREVENPSVQVLSQGPKPPHGGRGGEAGKGWHRALWTQSQCEDAEKEQFQAPKPAPSACTRKGEVLGPMTQSWCMEPDGDQPSPTSSQPLLKNILSKYLLLKWYIPKPWNVLWLT